MSNNSHPKFIAVQDFNNDSRLDIVVANSGTNNIGILLGNGDGTFASLVTYSTGTDSQPSSVAIGDFNNDRQLDIVVANYGSNNIGILLGNGDGTFMRQTTFPTGSSRPIWVDIGDFNSDSLLDIVFVNYGTNYVSVVFGYGNGTFTNQTILSATYDSLPFSVVIDDFNNDNKLDIAVANYGTHNIAIFLGDGNGTFPIQTTSSTDTESHPYAIATADFNHDTKMDIVVVNSEADSVCVLFGYGNGTFLMQATYSTETDSQPIAVVVGDFNYDNRLDIVVANTDTNEVGIFLGYGNGTFRNQTSFPTGFSSKPYFIASGDFNSDGRLDIAVANYGTNNIGILLAYSNITLSSQKTYSTDLNSKPSSVAVGDFNNDDRIDIVVTNSGNANVGVFSGNGDGTFSSQKTYFTGDATNPNVVAVGDFNNDSLLDIVVGYLSQSQGRIGILLETTDGIFSNLTQQNIELYSIPLSIAVGDFNNDSRLDIIVASGNDYIGIVRVLLGSGNGTFSNQMNSFSNSYAGPQSIAVSDFNNDTWLDFIVANKADSTIFVVLGNGDGTFSSQTSFSTGYYAQTQSVAIGDFNNDSRLDIVVANSWNTNVGVFLGYGNGNFSVQKTHSTGIGSNPSFVVVRDFNNDNRLDILVANRGIGAVIIFLGYGNGSFSQQLNYPTESGSQPLSVAIGDFRKDGLLDIAVANYGNNNVGVRLGFETANFVNEAPVSTGSSPGPRSVFVSDLNKDSRLEFAVANYITNNVEVYLGDGNGNFLRQMWYSTGPFSSPTSITVDDFNNDRHLDIAVSNSGTAEIGVFFGYSNGTFGKQTTYSTADDSSPQSIASGDFNNDSRPDIAVVTYDDDNLDVLLSFNGGRFGAQISYSTGYGSYPHGIAVGDMNNDMIIDIVVTNNGNGNIGVFSGIGDGTFSSQQTYSIGGITYPVAVTVGDVNNDTRVDIIVIDNVAHRVVLLLQHDVGSFSEHWSYDTGYNSWPVTVVVSDFNTDSRLDIVLCTFQTSIIFIFIGIGNGTFSLTSIYETSTEAGLASIAIGDFNNDSRLDIAYVHTRKQNVGIRLGNGDGTFSDQNIYPSDTGSLPVWIAVGDFDNDGRCDIVVINQGTNNICVLFGYGNGNFSDQVTISTDRGSQPTSGAVGDFNNDGRLDIVVANSQNGNVGVLLGYVNRTFFSEIILLTDDRFSLPTFVVVGDFNNDTRLDIAVCNGYSEHVGIFLALDEDTFLNVPPYSTGELSQPTYVAVGDLNKDSRLDVVVANYGTNNVMVFLGSGYGTFSSKTTYSTGNNSQPCWVAIGDLNNDTRLDIVVANSGNDNVGVLLSNGNGTFSSQMTYSTGVKSQPSSVTVGDFNHDSRMDIAVANYGSNTINLFFGYGNGSFADRIRFPAGYNSHPSALASGDVNKDNLSDIVIANNGYGNVALLLKLC